MKAEQVVSMAMLCVMALISTSAAQTPITFLPVLFVSPMPDRPSPDSAVMYGATICDGKLYNGNRTVASVNLPNGWNPTLGLFAKLEVCSDEECTKIYCSNYVSGKFSGLHSCNFTYNASMGDLFLRVTAGPSPNIDWTVAVEFLNTKQYLPERASLAGDFQERASLAGDFQERAALVGDASDFPEPIAKNGVRANIQILMQIVKTVDSQTVKTLGLKQFLFRFCPDRETGNRYDITIAVTGTDSKSAMATYVCLQSELPCSVTSSTHYDPRGIGVNTVTLTTGSAQLGELHVIVVGWGDGKQTNTFTLGATVTKKQ